MLVEVKRLNKREQIVVSSRDIAETFEKRHADVLRDIENLNCSAKFTERNFALSSYKDSSGKSNKEYLLTRDGFTIVAMGYNGEKAMRFKEIYIEQFNQMEELLQGKLIEREKGIAVRQSLTKAIQQSGENERMHNHAYSTYTDLIYRAVFGKNAKQLREEYGISKQDNLRDLFSQEDLAKVKSVEMVV
ncbi:MAG: Rha family transcriptional regulator, partial [Ruminococcus flavefaciens]|nr:Rha family transcriptional regulator [Ruminococcus flavefaciens]